MEFKKGFSYEAKLIIEVENVERCIGKVSKAMTSGHLVPHYIIHFLDRRMPERFSTEKSAKKFLLCLLEALFKACAEQEKPDINKDIL